MPNAQFNFIPDPVGNHVDFQYRPLNHLLLLHEEVPDHVENAVHLRKRLGLVLQHLAAHGRTSIVKGCSGSQIHHLVKREDLVGASVKAGYDGRYRSKTITNEVHLLCRRGHCLSSTPKRSGRQA